MLEWENVSYSNEICEQLVPLHYVLSKSSNCAFFSDQMQSLTAEVKDMRTLLQRIWSRLADDEEECEEVLP